MQKFKYNLGEILVLNDEISKLVSEDLAYRTKYWINKLGTEIAKESKAFQALNMEIFQKYGTKDENGNLTVLPDSKKFKEFQKELTGLLEQEVEIECAEFKLDDFDFKSGNNYLQFSKLISE